MFVNNCIGARNRKYFVGFVLSVTAMCVFGEVTCIFYLYWHMIRDPLASSLAMEHLPLFLMGLGLVLGGLCCLR